MHVPAGARAAHEAATAADGGPALPDLGQHRHAGVGAEPAAGNVHGLRRDARSEHSAAEARLPVGDAPLSLVLGADHHNARDEPAHRSRVQGGDAAGPDRTILALRGRSGEPRHRRFRRNPNEANSVLLGHPAHHGPLHRPSLHHVSLADTICFYR